jgi:hypothetical protein
MTTYTYAIQTTDDGRTWMPEAGAIGTEDYDGGPGAYAEAVLENRLAEGIETGPITDLRIVVWTGTQQDTAEMAAAVVYA